MGVQLLKNFENFSNLRSTAVSFGNFDGLHRGHRKIISTCLDGAKRKGLASVLFTFEPHPRKVLRPKEAPQLLWTRNEREELFSRLPMDTVLFQNFDQSFFSLKVADFIERVLKQKLRTKLIVCGREFRFGFRAEGTVDSLREAGFEVIEVVPEMDDQIPISSSQIRILVSDGKIGEANKKLGHFYFLTGQVEKGDGRGKTLGFPTANLRTNKECLPPAGVYSTVVERLSTGEFFVAATNLGVRPTFEGQAFKIESYLVDFKESIYNENLRVFFIERIRDEQKFSSPDVLVRQLQQDVEKVCMNLRSLKIFHDASPLQNFHPYEFLNF